MRRITALIADDSSIIRKILRRSLTGTGLADFEFIEAEDGQDAWEKYDPETIDIMFVDLKMPRLDGSEFLHRVRQEYSRRTPAVLITAETNPQIVMAAVKSADVDAFLFKPINCERLTKGLKTLIASLRVRSGPSAVPHGECVREALEETLQQTCGLELVNVDDDPEVRQGEVVVGSISLHGDLNWSLILGFEKGAVAPIVSRFAGFDIPFDSEDLGDAVGELTNIVAGTIQRKLSERSIAVSLTLPMVSWVNRLRVLTQRKNTQDHSHFECVYGKCWTGVTVGLNQGLVL